MKTKTELPKIEFKLIGIHNLKYEYNHPINQVEFKPGVVNYNIDPKVGFKVDLNQIIITLNIDAKIIQTDELFFKSSTVYVFEIADLKSIIVKSEDNSMKFKYPEQEEGFVLSLISVSYSTTRGMFIEKGAGTILQGDFLPVIDPNIFIKKKNSTISK